MIAYKPNTLIKLGLLHFFVLLFTSIQAQVNNVEVKKDTVIAQVSYGNDQLIEGIDTMSVIQLEQYRDSLSAQENPPSDLISQINIYLKIREMNFDEIYQVIDSLFELKTIPIGLINELNEYIALHQYDFQFADEIIDTSQYPADYYYHNWNTITPNPYNTKNLIENDSVIMLNLTGTKRSPNFVIPIQNVITSKFGWRDGRMHKGIDIDLEVWDPVSSAFAGMVRVARTYKGYGRVVVIRHFNGLETLYAHLHRIKVEPGQIIEAGHIIGLGGSSGQSTGSHLHWEVRFKGDPINPLNFVDYKNEQLVHKTLVLHKTKHGFIGYPKGSVFYTVQNGDFLYKIARNFGTTVSSLCKLNGINRNSSLYVGQKLRVI